MTYRSDPWWDFAHIHDCHNPDHANEGNHLHEVQPGRWRMFRPANPRTPETPTPERNQP